jgi:hypothetical protein
MRYFTKSERVHTELLDIYRAYLYRPATQALLFLSHQAKRIQSGTVHP